jgi:hypothetical protein
MWNLLRRCGIGLLVLGIVALSSPAQAEKKVSTEDQVAVLLKWYRTYFGAGRYKQAEQIAQLAYELAPDDPQIVVALKLARRQQARVAATVEVEAQLALALQKLDRMERQLKTAAGQNRQRTILQIAQEPPGSPDGPVKK